VAAPLVRCQDDDEDVAEEFVETETAASPEAAGAAAGAGIADLATDYLNTATELGKQYVGQAAEVAQQYLGSYGVSTAGQASMRGSLFNQKAQPTAPIAKAQLCVCQQAIAEATHVQYVDSVVC